SHHSRAAGSNLARPQAKPDRTCRGNTELSRIQNSVAENLAPWRIELFDGASEPHRNRPVQNLDGDMAGQARTEGAIPLTHATRPQPGQDPVPEMRRRHGYQPGPTTRVIDRLN